MDRAKFYERAGEKTYENIQSPLEDKKIEAMANTLKRAGYKFDLKEDKNEYSLEAEGFDGIMHMTKVKPLYLRHGEGDSDIEECDIVDAIKALIINPNGSIYKTIHAENFEEIGNNK